MPALLLNVVRVDVDADAKLSVGVQPFDKEKLARLRDEHRGNYFFKRGGEEGNAIHAIALKPDLPALGAHTEEQQVGNAHWLLAPLTMDALLRFFVEKERPILKLRPLRILSQHPVNFFPADSKLPEWLQRRVVLTFETRTVRKANDTSTVYLACGVGTRNIINASCSKMLADNVPLIGRYVETRRDAEDPRVESYLSLAGRVTAVRGSRLILEDHGDGPSSIDASDAYLEPRIENMTFCVDHYAGSKARRILEQADASANRQLSGPERLDFISKTFDYLRKQTIEIAPGLPIVLGTLAGRTSGSLPSRSEFITKPRLVFDPSGTKTDTWNERGLDQNGPYDQRTFTPKQLRIAVICQAVHEGRVDAFLGKFLDGMPDVKTGGRDPRAPYAKGLIRRYSLESPKLRTFTADDASVGAYAAACRRAVEAATDGGFEWNLAIVQIDHDFRELPGEMDPRSGTA